jgi:hypothetical protein
MTALVEAYRQVQEAKPTKASDYLVVEDTKKPATEHLPVKHDGKSAKTKEMAEFYDDEAVAYIPYSITTFAGLQAAEEAEQAADSVRRLTIQFREIVTNILWNSDVDDKIGAIRALVDEYATLLDQKVEEGDEDIVVETGDQLAEEEPLAGDQLAEEEPLAEFAESIAGTVTLSEDLPEVNDNRAPLLMDLALIQPGWGNKKDMHYYPGDMLKRDAPVFEGAKMYATDHHQDEKSVRTEVAVIQSITGYTETGAPIGRVAVHDPDFAEATRNRARLGTLETLECSILARGKTRKGEVDGKTGHIVESITEAISVDFVTKAGAGGHAINLAEGGEPVDDKKLEEKEQVQEETPTQDDPPEKKEAEVTMLEGEQVQALLSETNLPAAAKTKVAGMEFRSEDEAKTAIQAEIDYVKELTGSGNVSDLGESNPPDEKPRMSEAEYQAAYNGILTRHGMEPIYKEVSDNVN